MDNKVLLAVYGVTITSGSDTQIPSDFGGSVDLLKLFHKFADFVFVNVQKLEQENRNSYALTCSAPPRIVIEDRESYGFFKAGRDGEAFTVAKFNAAKPEVKPESIDVTRDSHIIRDAFFYMQVPGRQKKAYLVLQRSHSQGIKGLVNRLFQKFMAAEGLQKYRMNLENLVDDKVFVHMLDNGHLKEITVIKNRIPLNIKEVHSKDDGVLMGEGTVKAVYQAPDLSPTWREWSLDLMSGKRKMNAVDGDPRVRIELGGVTEYVNEVSFRVELKQKQKTFHLVNSERTQPDIDVTENVRLGADGKYIMEDLLMQARELINDVNLRLNEDDTL
ncbi:MAG: hypothetical protein EOO61_02860 [Hymenobacter sp.]|nr:MAG: hypothetical protein EOO61_02860 [Hymenobacter sp.]